MMKLAGRSADDQINLYRGGAMAGKKDFDATKNLPPDEPTQVTDKGLKIGLPKKKDVLDALSKVARKPAK